MSKSDYKKALRKTREEKFLAALKHNGTSVEEIRASHGQKKVDEIRKKYFSGVQRIQNRTRGRQGELIASVAIEKYGLCTFAELKRDCTTYQTPHGERRIDLFYEKERVAIEAKSGRVYRSKKMHNQVDKDHWLLTEGLVERVIWILCYGSSATFFDYADKRGIEIWELTDEDRKLVADLVNETQLVSKSSWTKVDSIVG